MSATPPEVSWPALDVVIADARRIGADAVANALVQAVTTGSTSGEILNDLGQLLRTHRAFGSVPRFRPAHDGVRLP